MNLIVVNGGNTLIHSEPWPILAPVDQSRKVQSALICTQPPHEGFVMWQEVTYYFFVDLERAALVQRPGIDLTGMQILVLLS